MICIHHFVPAFELKTLNQLRAEGFPNKGRDCYTLRSWFYGDPYVSFSDINEYSDQTRRDLIAANERCTTLTANYGFGTSIAPESSLQSFIFFSHPLYFSMDVTAIPAQEHLSLFS